MDDRLSWDELYPFMDEVKALARGLPRCECRASLQTTALVLSALRRQRLADQDGGGVTWANRRYFFSPMYQAMTRALLDARATLKQAQLPWVEAIEYRCYGELTHEETARMMAVDDCTLRRWWERAHPVLAQRLLQLLNAGIAEEQRP